MAEAKYTDALMKVAVPVAGRMADFATGLEFVRLRPLELHKSKSFGCLKPVPYLSSAFLHVVLFIV
jgi:hypothetical protein